MPDYLDPLVYRDQPKDFYERQLTVPGFRGYWFRRRQEKIEMLLDKYSSGECIVDLGCGNSLWNKSERSVIGLDLCLNMLKHNGQQGHFNGVQSDCFDVLPFRSDSVDSLVMSEVLEHTSEPEKTVAEIYRVLKPGGVAFFSVPYEHLPGLWGLVFPLWCFYKGRIQGDSYYKCQCGHRVSFRKKDLITIFKDFEIIEMSQLLLLTFFIVVRK